MPSGMNYQSRIAEPAYVSENDSREMEIDLVELMYRILEKSKWIIAFALVGLIAAGLITEFIMTPKYEATAKIYVLESKNNVVDLSAINLSDKLAADYIQVFNNWHVHEKVISSLGLIYTYEEIQEMLEVEILPSSRIIQITVESTDPTEAYNIAMAYAQIAPAFIEAKMETSRPNIFEEARIPEEPSSPNMILNLAIGACLGIAITMAFVLIQFLSDDRVRNAEMLQKRLGLPTLGMVPVQESSVVRNGKGKKE